MEHNKLFRREHPYGILRRLRVSVILILLSVLQQILVQPQGILMIISSLGISALYVIAFLFYALSLYSNFKYWIDRKMIHVRSGVFVSKNFHISFDNICTIVFYRDLFSTVFGAERISVDTPSGSRKKFDVSAYSSLTKAKEIRLAGESAALPTKICRPKTMSILLMSAFWSNPVTGIIFIVPIIQNLGKIVGNEVANALVRGSIDSQWHFWSKFISPVAATLITIILLSWTISMLLCFMRYVRFKSYRLGEYIVIYRGFPGRSITYTKISELASVNIEQSLLMKLLRLKSCTLSVIGSGKLKGDRGMIISASKSDYVYRKMYELTGISAAEKQTLHAAPHSVFSYIYLPLLALLIPFGFSQLHHLLPRLTETCRFLAYISLFVVIWWLIFRIFSYRNAHIGLNQDHLIVCGFRRLTLRKHYIKPDKIQRVEISQSIFQKRSGKCNVRIYVYFDKKKICVVKQLPKDKAEEMLKKFELF